MSPVLFLNLEGGLLSVAGQPGVDEVKISNSAEMDEAYFALAKRQNGFGHYKTIVIDSGTVFANRVLIEWAQRNALRAQRKGRGDPDRTIDDIQLEDYGKMTAQIRRTVVVVL
jgi:phosphatidylserine/phosphatidylglycerophosphate/cardiolipin synthase-like enzyme